MDEPTAWAAVAQTATDALNFWNGFLALRSSDQALTPDQLSRLLCIVRAVSWVESQHGTGGGLATAATDPMQCGQDTWWTELSSCDGGQDVFVCGNDLKSRFNACQLPAQALVTGTLPDQANLNNMADITQGNKDAVFNVVMSYYWGIPYLLHATNHLAAKDPTYQCSDLNTLRLVTGAVYYNGGHVDDAGNLVGGGDPNYPAKIQLAVANSGCLS